MSIFNPSEQIIEIYNKTYQLLLADNKNVICNEYLLNLQKNIKLRALHD